MNGLFDYNATPIAPQGIKTLVYKTPQQRKTWAQHGVDAWYISYCPDHYRCHKTYVPATRGERISHIVSFLPHDFSVPANNQQDDIARSIWDLTTALQHRYLHTPLQPVGDKQVVVECAGSGVGVQLLDPGLSELCHLGDFFFWDCKIMR